MANDPFGLVGKTLAEKYRLDEVIGEGGFGVVYRGFHLGLEHPIAIKCLKVPPHFTPGAQKIFLEKFREEGKLLARLSSAHLGIVRVFDFGVETTDAGVEVPFLVLEWLEGQPLDVVLQERVREAGRPFDEGDALALMRPAIEALARAHEMGIAHRDIKPGNLFVLDTSHGRTTKVLDFGIAKVMHEGETATQVATQTSSGFSAFSPQHGAPEQFRAKKLGATGPWTDVHALGLILVELVTGRPAYEGEELADFLEAGTAAARPTPRARGATVSDGFEALCAKALSVRPADRYADASEVLLAIDGLRRRASTTDPNSYTETVSAAPIEGALAAHAARAPRRGLRMKLALSVAGGLAIAGAIAFAARGWTHRSSSSPPPVGEPAEDAAPPAAYAPNACDTAMSGAISALQEPVFVEVYARPEVASLQRVADETEQRLKWISEASRGKLIVSRFSAADPTHEAEAADAGLQPAQFSEVSDSGVAQVVQGRFGIVARYRGRSSAIPMYASSAEVLGKLATQLRILVDTTEKRTYRFGLVVGEVTLAEPELDQGSAKMSFSSAVSELLPQYKLEAVDPSNIPAGLTGLILTQPAAALEEPALRQIDGFLMRGDRSLIVIASAVMPTKKSSGSAGQGNLTVDVTVDPKGLPRLLDAYGLKMSRALVLDDEQSMPGSSLGRQVKLDLSPIPAVRTADPSTGTSATDAHVDRAFFPFTDAWAAFPFASPIELAPASQPDASVRAVAWSSEHAQVMTAPFTDVPLLRVQTPPTSPRQRYVLAAATIGRIRSAFGEGAATGRVLLVASSLFPVNPFNRLGLKDNPREALVAMASDAYARFSLKANASALAKMFLWSEGDASMESCTAQP